MSRIDSPGFSMAHSPAGSAGFATRYSSAFAESLAHESSISREPNPSVPPASFVRNTSVSVGETAMVCRLFLRAIDSAFWVPVVTFNQRNDDASGDQSPSAMMAAAGSWNAAAKSQNARHFMPSVENSASDDSIVGVRLPAR